MTSIVELFPKSRKLAYDSRQQLAMVQNDTLHPSELFLSLEELNRQLDIMDSLLQRETPAQQQKWRRKVDDLRQEAASVKRQGEYHQRVASVGLRQQRERDELMRMRRRRGGGNAAGGDEHAAAMGDLADESDSWASSQNMVGDIINSGQATLGGLVEQRQRLKGVKRTLLDMGQKLGFSNSMMRIVERRDITDAYLVFGGMFVTCVVLYFCFLR